MNPGTILYDTAFQFSNTQVIDKLSVVLCELGHDHVVVITTSKQRTMNVNPGCQLQDKPPNFFIPKGSSWFREDTWIQLNEVYEVARHVLDVKINDRTAKVLENVLAPSLIKDLLDCVLKSIDIEGYYLEYIERARQTV